MATTETQGATAMTETATCRICGTRTRYADGYGPICGDTATILAGGADEVLADDPTETLTDCRSGATYTAVTETAPCRICYAPTDYADGYGPICPDTATILSAGADDPTETLTDCRTGAVLADADA